MLCHQCQPAGDLGLTRLIRERVAHNGSCCALAEVIRFASIDYVGMRFGGGAYQMRNPTSFTEA